MHQKNGADRSWAGEGRVCLMSQKVVFTFDEASLANLKEIKEKMGFSSLGSAVRDSIDVSETLQDEVENGFTEIIVRNPKTNEEKTIVIPSLKKYAKIAAKTSAAG